MDKTPKRSALVVAAEPCARRGQVLLLEEHPLLQVCAAIESAAEARDLRAKLRPAVMVLDPAQGDGFALIRELPRWSAETRMVVQTGLEDSGSVQRAFRCGALAGERHPGPRAERGRLSPRERDVFDRMGAGLSTRQTALELGTSVKTVKTHRQRIKGKLDCVSGSELLRSAVMLQTAEPPPATSGNGRLATTGGSGRADR